MIERLFVYMSVSFLLVDEANPLTCALLFLEAVKVVVVVSRTDFPFEFTVALTADPQAPGTKFRGGSIGSSTAHRSKRPVRMSFSSFLSYTICLTNSYDRYW